MALILDHIGIITPNLEQLASVLGCFSEFQNAGPVVEDLNHFARIQFLACSKMKFPRLELIEPIGGESPLNRGLEQGGGSHHFCFQVASVASVDAWCRKTSIRKVFGPNHAPAFGEGRDVVFAHAPGLGLVEFVSTPGAPDISEYSDLSASPLVKSFLAKRKEILLKGSGVE